VLLSEEMGIDLAHHYSHFATLYVSLVSNFGLKGGNGE
jgi:hypothetical protein